jgi:ribosomal silencing factor RsfS
MSIWKQIINNTTTASSWTLFSSSSTLKSTMQKTQHLPKRFRSTSLQQQQQQQKILPVYCQSSPVLTSSTKRYFASSNKNNDDSDSTREQEARLDASSSEDWIPPSSSSSTTTSTTKDNDFYEQQIIQKQYVRKNQQEDALFVLSEEEQKTLSDDEILQRLEKILEQEEEFEKQIFEQQLNAEEEIETQTAATDAPDWLQTRRAALGKTQQGNTNLPPIRKHELLSCEEIQTLLEHHGGSDVVVLPDNPDQPRLGGGHTIGMIVCTVDSPYMITTLTRLVIETLKGRELQDLGVLGAQMGTNHLAATESTWHVIDCGNYIVHILDSTTRRSLQLEKLWSGQDPLWKLEYWDETAIDNYCEKHPVPDEYNGGVESSRLSTGLWDPSMVRRLERNERYYDRRQQQQQQQAQQSSPLHHRPVISNAIKRQDRRAGRKKRREQKQRQRQQQQSY